MTNLQLVFLRLINAEQHRQAYIMLKIPLIHLLKINENVFESQRRCCTCMCKQYITVITFYQYRMRYASM